MNNENRVLTSLGWNPALNGGANGRESRAPSRLGGGRPWQGVRFTTALVSGTAVGSRRRGDRGGARATHAHALGPQNPIHLPFLATALKKELPDWQRV